MIKTHKKTRTLIALMSVLVILAIVFSKWYYKNQNESVDPRIVLARGLYENYNRYAERNNLDSIFFLMDTIESLYKSVTHYSESFEVGVLYNNRAAAWLTIALFSELRDSIERDSMVALAENAIWNSIQIYTNWETSYNGLSENEVRKVIEQNFYTGLEKYPVKDKEKYLQTRTSEILDAETEIPRRLSVSYTNLGIVHRYRQQYDSAALSYQKALELWDRNLTAENNLNILLGRPQKKRNLIQRMFPPDRL